MRILRHGEGEVIPFVGFVFQAPGDEEDLTPTATEEPLTVAVAAELDSTLPEGPPLPMPTVASERVVTPVSVVRGTEIWPLRSSSLTEERRKVLGGTCPWLATSGFQFGS